MGRLFTFLTVPFFMFVGVLITPAPEQVIVYFQPGVTLEEAVAAIKPHTDYLCESDFFYEVSQPIPPWDKAWHSGAGVCYQDRVAVADYIALNAGLWADAYFILNHQGYSAYALCDDPTGHRCPLMKIRSVRTYTDDIDVLRALPIVTELEHESMDWKLQSAFFLHRLKQKAANLKTIVSQKSFVPHSSVQEWDKTFLDSYIFR